MIRSKNNKEMVSTSYNSKSATCRFIMKPRIDLFPPKFVLDTIISGGQTGADEGGLEAGKYLGLKTGGWMPKRFRRLDWKGPWIARLYGMKEHVDYSYPGRTGDNVRDSDATVRFASNFFSTGELCTMKFIEKYNKPYFNINIYNPDKPLTFLKWLMDNRIRVLNVAGNSEQTSKGIKKFVVGYLVRSLEGAICVKTK